MQIRIPFEKLKWFICIIIIFTSCSTHYYIKDTSYKNYIIGSSLQKDAAIYVMMQPYRDSVATSLNNIIGYTSTTLQKVQPEGTLGNFMADALLYMAQQKFGVPVDAAFINEGGIRLNQLPAGAITRSKIFELMPFDNRVVVQRIKGSVLQEFLNLTARNGGWPVAGITMQLQNNKAINVTINGASLDTNKIYTIANSDYVANGGDNAAMLTTIPQEDIGCLMRDALVEYIQILNNKGVKNLGKLQNRIINAQ